MNNNSQFRQIMNQFTTLGDLVRTLGEKIERVDKNAQDPPIVSNFSFVVLLYKLNFVFI